MGGPQLPAVGNCGVPRMYFHRCPTLAAVLWRLRGNLFSWNCHPSRPSGRGGSACFSAVILSGALACFFFDPRLVRSLPWACRRVGRARSRRTCFFYPLSTALQIADQPHQPRL